MKIGDRILLILAMLLCIAGCGYVVALSWGWLPLAEATRVMLYIAANWQMQVLVTIGAIVLIALFIKLMFVRAGGANVKLQGGLAITSQGDVRITADALCELCNHVALQVPGVRTATCGITQNAQGLNVSVKANCSSEQSVPQTGAQLQGSIKQVLIDTCGITNANVQVLVERAEPTAAPAATVAPVMTQPPVRRPVTPVAQEDTAPLEQVDAATEPKQEAQSDGQQ